MSKGTRKKHRFEAAGLGKPDYILGDIWIGESVCRCCRKPISLQYIIFSDWSSFGVGIECLLGLDDDDYIKRIARIGICHARLEAMLNEPERRNELASLPYPKGEVIRLEDRQKLTFLDYAERLCTAGTYQSIMTLVKHLDKPLFDAIHTTDGWAYIAPVFMTKSNSIVVKAVNKSRLMKKQPEWTSGSFLDQLT